MKRFFSITAIAVALVALVATSCQKEPEFAGPPTVKIELKSQAVESAVFAVTATNASEVYFYCSESGTVKSNS